MSERRAWGFPLPAPGGTAPALDRFRELAPGRRVIPVVRRLLADGEMHSGERLAADNRCSACRTAPTTSSSAPIAT